MKLFNFMKRAAKNLIWGDFYLERLEQQMHQMQERQNYVLARQKYEYLALHATESGTTSDLHDGEELIVSLTTYSKRIHTVFRVIESIFQQTLKPNRVILWLAEDEFTLETLPLSLKRQMSRGLEVRFVKNLRSYKKLVPAMINFPNAVIVTVDDDVFYAYDMLERLWNVHRQQPKAVCGMMARKLQLTSPCQLKEYDSLPFVEEKTETSSPNYILEGFGGILYPPHVLHPDVLNEEAFLKLAPYGDDIWFKAMALRNDTPVVLLRRDFPIWQDACLDWDVQDIGLLNQNCTNNRNDSQLKAVFDHYKLYEKLEK